MTSKESGSTTTNEGSIQLKLSDVIRIVAPDNQLFNHQLFFIDYIDEERLNLVNMDTMDILKLRIHEGGVLGDGTIQEIVVVSRAPLEGYARQHGLVVGKWIDVYFDGPTPSVITGEITNLESDMIEVRTYNDSSDTENEYLYFNFDYKGLPQNVMINRIELRPAPEVALPINADVSDTSAESLPLDNVDLDVARDDLEELVEQGVDERPPIEELEADTDDSDLEEGEVREDSATKNKLVANKTILGEYIITAKQRNIGASLDAVETMRTVDKSKERHTLTTQTDDLLDDLIMKQDEGSRGFRSTNSLAIEIERYVQLRKTYSLMDNYFNVTGIKTNTDNWKPMVEDIVRMRHPLLWVVPVTKMVRNIYDVPVPGDEDIGDIQSLELMDELETSHNANEQAYMSGANNDVVNKYRQYISSLANTFASFSETSVEDRDIIATVETPVDQYSVINNITNFRSSCISGSTSAVSTSRMVKQQYLAPTSLLVTRDPNMNSAERTERVPVSTGERMAIRSIMTLPYSITRFSLVSRPGTSIDQKVLYSTMYSTYFKTLGRKTKVHTVAIDSLTSHNKYNRSTFNNFTNYQMGPDLMDATFEDYVRAIVPTTKQLVEMLADKMKDKLNAHDFITLLEPYSIYAEDITETQYSDIKTHVNKNISQYLDDKKIRWKILSRIKKMAHSNQFSSRSIADLYTDSSENALEYQYNQSGLNYSNSELLSRMVHLDYGRALTDVMSRQTSDILVHEKVDTMLDIFREDDTSNKDKEEKKEGENKCKMVIIAKQYFSQEEMQRDNKTTIYFDRKYDDTNYTMLIKKNDPFANTIEKFDTEYSQMTPENFFTFIRSKVRGSRPNSVSDAEVEHLTDTLIVGKKRVRDGEYALLHDDGEGAVLYFRRTNDTWKVDEQMSATLLTDSAALNCSLEPGCVYNENSMSVDDKCVSVSETKALMHENILKEIINRFDEKLAATAQELRTYLAERVARSQHLVKVLKTRRTYEMCKYDLKQFAIGVEMVASGVTQVATRSPHMELKQKIVAQKDLNNKYTDLVFFINRYTEECVDGNRCDDDGGNARRWRYCKITKTPLLPVFMHELALAWMEDGNDYSRPSYKTALQRIIRENGAESDDGSHWVDKFSGETIARKDFDTEEGFDNGHKIVSRGVSQEDFETTYMREIRSAHDTVVKYTTHDTILMYKIVTAIAGFMNISLVPQMEFIIKLASTMMTAPNVMVSEAKYKDIIAARSVDGQKTIPYDVYYGEIIMYLTLGAVLIGIQTSVPSIITKKTYPGCVRSFTGYPFDGDGDITGLVYLACVARKGTTTIGPWSVLRRKSPETIMKKIRTYIDTYYIKHVDVTAKINAKREYLMEHPDETILDENRVEQWTTFMPPIRTVRLSRMDPVVSGFQDLLISDIKIGSSAQWSKMDVIQGKLVQFSLAYQVGIQQLIDEVKGHRDSTDELFIDNFGNKSLGKTQHEYFSSLNGDLPRIEAIIRGMHQVVLDVKRLSRALTIFCGIDDKNARASLGNDYNEVTIYQAFISICRFNRQEILDEDLEAICGGKPDNFSNSDTISEKIRKMKDQGKVYDGIYLEKLLRVSGTKNQVVTQYDTGMVTQVQRLRNVITRCRETMDDENHSIAEIMRHLDIVLDTFDYDTYRSSPDVRALRNTLSKQSDHMRKDITMFIDDHVTASPAQKKIINAFLVGISSWEDDISTQHAVAQSNSYYNLFTFISTYIQNLITVFPHAIQHKVDHSTTMAYSTAKRNSLSRKAVDAINSAVESDYTGLETFYDEPSIKHILSDIASKCETINKLAKHTPYFTEIPTSGDKTQTPIVSVLDKTTCKMLFEYYMLSTMHAYVELSSDERMLNIDVVNGYSIEDLRDRETSDMPRVDPGIYMSDMKKMRSTTARLLHQYIQMMYKHKNVVQTSYTKIMDTNFKIREGEKELITTRLADMAEQADRDLDNIKKANKQGVWGKGLQKSLRFHVKDDYDNERVFADRMQEIEQHVRSHTQGVTDENISQYKDDYLADMDRQMEEDEDERDMSRVRGDDADGDPYGEEDEENDEY
jgi:hypothetical protein